MEISYHVNKTKRGLYLGIMSSKFTGNSHIYVRAFLANHEHKDLTKKNLQLYKYVGRCLTLLAK